MTETHSQKVLACVHTSCLIVIGAGQRTACLPAASGAWGASSSASRRAWQPSQPADWRRAAREGAGGASDQPPKLPSPVLACEGAALAALAGNAGARVIFFLRFSISALQNCKLPLLTVALCTRNARKARL
jgi:hypothetical protein